MIIDAGGGTVDFSTYKITQVAPIALQEIAPTDCMFLLATCSLSLFSHAQIDVALD